MIGHEEYLSFHKDLAISHVDLAHNDTSNPAFCGTNTEEFTSMLKGDCNPFIMHMMPLRGRITSLGKFTGSKDLVRGGFVLLGITDHSRKEYREEETVLDKAKEIGMDIVTRINFLQEQGSTPFHQFDLSEVRYQMFGYLHQSWTGYEFDYPLSESCKITHNPAKWQ